MSLTPEQIEGAVFSTVKRDGYSREQVDRFLRLVADDYRSTIVHGQAFTPSPAPAPDLEAASAEMAAMLRDLHVSIGERRRAAEAEAGDLRAAAEREAGAIISAAHEQSDAMRQQAERVLADAEHQSEALRSDGEQRVRERCAETLRAARGELQELLRRKHEILSILGTARERIGEAEQSLERAVFAPDAMDDTLVSGILVDLREQAAASQPGYPPPPPPLPPVHPASGHPAAGHPAGGTVGSIFTLPDGEI